MTLAKNFERALNTPKNATLYRFLVTRLPNSASIRTGAIRKGITLGSRISYSGRRIMVWQEEGSSITRNIYGPAIGVAGVYLLFRDKREVIFWKSYLERTYLTGLSGVSRYKDNDVIVDHINRNYRKINRLYKESKGA